MDTSVSGAGSVSVTISPQAVVSAGARWRVDGGVWQASGATVLGLSAGVHTVSFDYVSNWLAPVSIAVPVSPGQTVTSNGAYIQPDGGLWQSATDLGNGWYYLSWFGDFYPNASGWIYHAQLGWLFPSGSSTSNIWMWDTALNSWVWTSDTTFPNIYRQSDGVWLFYDEWTTNPCLFWNFTTNSWESH